MPFPTESDRPAAETSTVQSPAAAEAPPLAPTAPEQSPWWSAPAGKPFGIPDFAHECAALVASLFPAPQPVTARRSR